MYLLRINTGTPINISQYSASGLGFATVSTLVHSGAYVAVFDVNKPADLESFSNRVHFYQVDISSHRDVQRAVEETFNWIRLNNAPLGGAVCCAGILAPGKVCI